MANGITSAILRDLDKKLDEILTGECLSFSYNCKQTLRDSIKEANRQCLKLKNKIKKQNV